MFRSDENDLGFFCFQGAAVTARLSRTEDFSVVQFFGNREGIASLANILLWMQTNNSRREFLSLTGLPFVTIEGDISLVIRICGEDAPDYFGVVTNLDGKAQFEWQLSDDDLLRVAVNVFQIAADPWHEYNRLASGDAEIEFRLTDLDRWI